jgi:hypothetical protein
MRKYITILTIFLITFSACSDSKLPDKNIELKAMNIAEKIDSTNIQTLYEWGIGHRGNADIFTKYSDSSSQYIDKYSCFYYEDTDSTEITIREFANFSKDFPNDILIDTSKYYLVEISKYNNASLRIVGVEKNGHDEILTQNIPLNKIFATIDPFDKLKKLSDLKKSLGILQSSYRPDIGNFIQLYLSQEYILTYLPDNNNLNPQFKSVWLKEFAKGRVIKKNWNLRKLDIPIEGE